MTRQEFWQHVFITVIAKPGCDWDTARDAANAALRRLDAAFPPQPDALVRTVEQETK